MEMLDAPQLSVRLPSVFHSNVLFQKCHVVNAYAVQELQSSGRRCASLSISMSVSADSQAHLKAWTTLEVHIKRGKIKTQSVVSSYNFAL